MWDEIGDKGAMHRMCRYGRKGSNQYTDRQERPTGPETPHAESSVWKMGHMDKVCTLESLAKKNRRKVCGHLSRICFFFFFCVTLFPTLDMAGLWLSSVGPELPSTAMHALTCSYV